MKALITATFDESSRERLGRHMDVDYDDWRLGRRIFFDGAEFAERIEKAGADVLIVEADLVHDDVLDRCELRLLGCCRGDPININVERATRMGIPVLYTPARNADAVADLAVAYMLALARNIVTVNLRLRQGQMRFASTADYLQAYEQYGGCELGGMTVGIVGLGGSSTIAPIRSGASSTSIWTALVCESEPRRGTVSELWPSAAETRQAGQGRSCRAPCAGRLP